MQKEPIPRVIAHINESKGISPVLLFFVVISASLFAYYKYTNWKKSSEND